MIQEYEVLYTTRECSAWEYVGKVNLTTVQKIMALKGPDCNVLHVCVSGSLSKEEKREIAARHGI